MYYSVNICLLSISTDGELEDLKCTEKALRSEGVAVFQFLYFLQKDKIKRVRLTMDLETSLRGSFLPRREDSIPSGASYQHYILNYGLFN